ncbi:MAG: hypothetical protein JW705_03475 [Methanosarcinaceae archaeon]|nr:hypothetical protein [Methanosarcinaceae archaeon]
METQDKRSVPDQESLIEGKHFIDDVHAVVNTGIHPGVHDAVACPEKKASVPVATRTMTDKEGGTQVVNESERTCWICTEKGFPDWFSGSLGTGPYIGT